jgi:hypothetical protein
MWLSWNGRSVTLYVYKHGIELTSSAKYGDFKNSCLVERNVDRAGAAAEEVHQQIMNQLEERHPQITADRIFYRVWADFIVRLPISEREAAMNDLPPKEIIHFFSASRSELSTRAAAAKDSIFFGMEMLDVMAAQLKDMRNVCLLHFMKQKLLASVLIWHLSDFPDA